MIKVRLASVDGYSKSKTFKTLTAARKFAVNYVGATPTFGSSYAVSDDGVCTIYVSGVTLTELFGVEDEKAKPFRVMVACADETRTSWFEYDTFATLPEALALMGSDTLDVYDGQNLVGATPEATAEIDAHYARVSEEMTKLGYDPETDDIPF